MNTLITVVDVILTDRKGQAFSAWFVYRGAHVISVEYVRNHLLPTERIELAAA